MLLILVAALASTPCSSLFVFQGQPDCVELSFTDGTTELTHACPHPVWIDQAVRLPEDPAGPVPADTTVRLRDHSTFTMGMGGELFRVVAGIDPTCDTGL